MPLATHPDATFKVVLSTDKHLPADKQPVFIMRYVSTLEWKQIARINDEFEKAVDSATMLDLAYKVLNQLLVGWDRMITPDGNKISFDLKKLPGMLSMHEATELMMAAVSQRPSVEDKKKFDSLSDSSTGRSAKTAKGRKRAKTSRRRKNR